YASAPRGPLIAAIARPPQHSPARTGVPRYRLMLVARPPQHSPARTGVPRYGLVLEAELGGVGSRRRGVGGALGEGNWHGVVIKVGLNKRDWLSVAVGYGLDEEGGLGEEAWPGVRVG